MDGGYLTRATRGNVFLRGLRTWGLRPDLYRGLQPLQSIRLSLPGATPGAAVDLRVEAKPEVAAAKPAKTRTGAVTSANVARTGRRKVIRGLRLSTAGI
jgi:hypothetical protein